MAELNQLTGIYCKMSRCLQNGSKLTKGYNKDRLQSMLNSWIKDHWEIDKHFKSTQHEYNRNKLILVNQNLGIMLIRLIESNKKYWWAGFPDQAAVVKVLISRVIFVEIRGLIFYQSFLPENNILYNIS